MTRTSNSALTLNEEQLHSSRKFEEKAPIFVVGAPRSGTTLVGQILGRHTKVATLGESHFFEDIWTRRRALGQLQDEAEIRRAAERALTLYGRFNFLFTQSLVDRLINSDTLVKDVKHLGGGYRALYLALTGRLVRAMGKARVCDDTPKHLYYLHDIYNLFPEARVVACVRDARDFLCSYKNYWRATAEHETERVRALYDPLVTSLLWRSSANLLQKHSDGCCQKRLHVVTYEKLVTSPAEVVRGMCSFLNLDYSDQLFQVEANNSSFKQETAGIFTTSIDRWPDCLEPEETWLVQTLAGDSMKTFGYRLEPVKPSRRRLLVRMLRAPFALLRAIAVNKMRRGPVLRYIWRRMVALLK